MEATAGPGSLGGSNNEKGSDYRAYVGAVLAACILTGRPLSDVGLEIAAVPTLISAETDDPVDDLGLHMQGEKRVFVQAKRAVKLDRRVDAPIDKAVQQFAESIKRGLAPSDRLVLATAKLSGPLQDVRACLRRRKLDASGAPSGPELKALGTFREIAGRYLSDEQIEQLLDVLLLWDTDPTQSDDRAFLNLLLESGVATAKNGARAAKALADVVRGLAQARGGLGGPGLIAALREEKIPLTDSADPTSPVGTGVALAKYRERVVKRAATLELLGVAGPLNHIPFEQADAHVQVLVEGDRSSVGDDLPEALRRRGRALLVGRPGGGKSTALRLAAAHWAERPSWPVPLQIDCRVLAAQQGDALDAILDAAVGHLHGDDRLALRRALELELAAGNCLLILDGFDEVRAGRKALAHRLARRLDELPLETEILLSSRPSAVEDAQQLELQRFELKAPNHAMTTVEAILRAAAPVEAPPDWVDARRGWISAAFSRDRTLEATPLAVVTLALIAAQSTDPKTLPSTRALVLQRALADLLQNWEIEHKHAGEITFGRLRGSRARDASRVILLELSTAAVNGDLGGADELTEKIAARLAHEFELSPGDLRVATSDALAFWDNAGLFSFDAAGVDALLRPFAELGWAWAAIDLDSAAREERLAQWRERADLWPALALAAGLDAAMAAAWADGLAAGGGEAELEAFATAVADGATVDLDSQAAVAEAVLSRTHDPVEVEAFARTVLDWELPGSVRGQLQLEILEKTSEVRRPIVAALLAASWDGDDEAALEQMRRVFDAKPPREWDYDAPHVMFAIPAPDHTYIQAFEAASLRLISRSREDAERVAAAFQDGSIEFVSALSGLLKEAGHEHLAQSVRDKVFGRARESRSKWPTLEDLQTGEQTLLEIAVALGTPRAMAQVERRRLDELASLWATARLQWARHEWVGKYPEQARNWLGLIALLGGFELSLISAQAELVLAEIEEGEGTGHLVHDHGEERPDQSWEGLPDPDGHAAATVDLVGIAPREIAYRAAYTLYAAPESVDTAALFERRMDEVINWSRHLSARFLLLRARDDAKAEELGRSDDPLLRAAAAEYWSLVIVNSDRGRPQWRGFLEDPDEEVRESALDHLEGRVPGDILDDLRRLRDDTRQAWQCHNCGASNPLERTAGCVSCSHTGAHVVRRVDELLAE